MGHLVMPLAATGLTFALGWVAVTLVAGSPAGAATGAAAALGVLTIAARAWTAGTPTVPVALYTPVTTPLGDMSVLIVAAFAVRGWLVVVALAWLTQTAAERSVYGLLAMVFVAVGLLAVAVGRAERV